MFWNRFDHAQTTDELFNQANEHWHQRQRFILEGDEESSREARAEVIRLCQISIQNDERVGDAYVLLANALFSAASQISRYTNPGQYEFLMSRAMAVIHFWYSLPHRSFPVTKKIALGDRLWRMTVDQFMQDKELPENEVIALMDRYRDSLAAETIPPSSFPEIQQVILWDTSLPEQTQVNCSERSEGIDRLLQDSVSALDNEGQSTDYLDLTCLIDGLLKQHRNELDTVMRSITPKQQGALLDLFLDELEQRAHGEFVRFFRHRGEDYQGENVKLSSIVEGKVARAYLIGYLRNKGLINYDDMHRYVELLAAILAQKLSSFSIELPPGDEVFSAALLKITLLWSNKYRQFERA